MKSNVAKNSLHAPGKRAGYALHAVALERRLMFSASPLAGVAAEAGLSLEGTDPAMEQSQISPMFQSESSPMTEMGDSSVQASTESQTRFELVFVDSSVEDVEQLLDQIDQYGDLESFEIYLLDADRDGVDQISEILEGYESVSAIHVLSHGNDGKIHLGDATLSDRSLGGYAGQIAAWSDHLTRDADILIYGCEVAETNAGRDLVDSIAALTGADVAASVDDTGSSTLGGDWDLEYSIGNIESRVISANTNWNALLATVEIFDADEQRVHETAAGIQSFSQPHQAVAADGNGNSVVVWTDDSADGDGLGVFARRFDGNGDAIGASFQVNVDSVGDQTLAVVDMDDSGRFVVAWIGQDSNQTGVFARRFNTSGVAIDSSDILVNSLQEVGTQTNVGVSVNNSNQIVFAWESDGVSEGIYSRTFDFTSTPAGNQLTTSLITVDGETGARDLAIDLNQTGRYSIVWTGDSNMYGRQYNFGSTTAVDSRRDINLGGVNEDSLAVATLSNNDYVIVYRSNVTFFRGVWLRLIPESSSAPLASPVDGDNSSFDPSIAVNENDLIVVTYMKDDANGTGIFARTYDESLDVVTTGITVNQSTTGNQENASVAMQDDDNFVVVWNGAGDRTGQVDSAGIFLRQFGTANQAPVAAVSPQTIAEGESVTLDGSSSSDADGDTLLYRWDLDNDGNFAESGEPSGESPTVDWATLQSFGIDDDGIYTIGLEVNDQNGGVVTTTMTLTVTDTAPVLSVAGASSVGVGQNYTLTLSFSDPGDDTPTRWLIDWGDGTFSDPAGSATTATKVYSVEGLTHNIQVAMTNEDGTFWTGDLFVGSEQATPISRFDAFTGTPELSFGSDSTLDRVYGLTIGPDGSLYASGHQSDNVQRFNPATGALLGTFVAAGAGGLDRPVGLAFGPDGNLYIADEFNDRVVRVNGSSGVILGTFVTPGSGGLNGPRDLFFAQDGMLYVSSTNSDQVLRYNSETGAFVDEFIGSGLDAPGDIAFGPDGNFYVASHGTDQILRYDATGSFLNVFATSTHPDGFAWGPDGSLFVTNHDSNEVGRFDSNGNSLGVYASGITNPRSVLVSPLLQVSVTLPANSAPTLTNGSQVLNYTEGDTSVAIGDIVVSDPDAGDTITATLTLDLPATGSLSTGTFGATTSTYNSASGVWLATGSMADVNAALADVEFRPEINNDVNSNVSVAVQDASNAAAPVGSIQLVVTSVNDAPEVDLDADDSGGAGAGNFSNVFSEGGSAVLIADSDASLIDIDSANLDRLDITITNLQDGAFETLSADTTGTLISASYSGGVLELTGTDSVANYRQVLRSVRYSNTSDSPNVSNRLISVVANDGLANSNTVTSTIGILSTNDAPVLDLDADNSSGSTGTGFSSTFTEGGVPVLIADNDASLVDVDSGNLTRVDLTITNLQDGAFETLSVDTTGTLISASYTGGVLELTGTDSVANYQQVLRSVRYSNTSDSPNVSNRLISVVANDGLANSNTVTSTIGILATNDAPVLDLDADNSSGSTGTGFSTVFTEGGTPVSIADSDASIVDLDDGTLVSLVVTITNLLDPGFETLSADTTGTSISASFSGGVLTLSGGDPVANFQSVLRTVRYENTAASPDTTTRAISIVADDGTTSSNVATSTVAIVSTNGIPTIDLDADNSSGASGRNYRVLFTEGGGEVPVVDVADAMVSDSDGTLSSLSVRITNLLDGASEILSADTSGTSISSSYLNGTLTLLGADTAANYQQVLRTIRYNNLSATPNTDVRVIQFVASDGAASSPVATAAVRIQSVNSAPVVSAPAAVTGTEDTRVDISGISITDADLGTGTIRVTLSVSRGTLTLDTGVAGGVTNTEVRANNTGSISIESTLDRVNATFASSGGLTYLGAVNGNGNETLVVTANDSVDSDSQSITLSILPTNDAPTSVNDRYSTPSGETLVVSSGGLLANDIDVDGDAVSVQLVSDASNGTVSVSADGNFVYTPAPGFSGTAFFTYTITDGVEASNRATVAIQVDPLVTATELRTDTTTTTDRDTTDEQEEESSLPSLPSSTIINGPTEATDGSGNRPRSISSVNTESSSSSPSLRRLIEVSNIQGSDVYLVGLGSAEYSSTIDKAGSQSRSQSNLDLLGIADFQSQLIWDDLAEVTEQFTRLSSQPLLVAGTFAGFSGALSVGYVVWTIRGGLLATSMLAHLPAWSFVDPLLVLSELEKEDDEQDDDSLEGMLDQNRSDTDASSGSPERPAVDHSHSVDTTSHRGGESL